MAHDLDQSGRGHCCAPIPNNSAVTNQVRIKMMNKNIYKLSGNENWFLEVDGRHVGQFFSKDMAEAAFALMVDRNNEYRNN
jgi:hypothetical protein